MSAIIKPIHKLWQQVPGRIEPWNRWILGITVLVVVAFTPTPVLHADENTDYYQALAYYHQKEWTKSEEALKEYSKKYPKSKWQPAVQLRLADMKEDPSLALKAYQDVLEQYKETEWADDACWGLAGTYFTLGQYQKTLDYLNIISSPAIVRGAQALHMKGLAYLALRDYKSSKETFGQLLENATILKYKQAAVSGLADAYFGLKNYDEALNLINQYMQKYPDSDNSGHMLKLKSQIQKIEGSIDDARQTMHQLVTKYPESFEAEKAKDQLQTQDEQNKYTIQVGSFSQHTYAEKLEKKLRTQGYNAYHLTNRQGDDVFVQVRVGHYTTKEFAEKIAEKLKEKEQLPYVIVPYIKPE